MPQPRIWFALAAVATVAGCSSDAPLEPCTPQTSFGGGAGASVAALPPSAFDAWFDTAARAHGIDAALLKAVAWTETRFHNVVPEHPTELEDHHGQPPAWGVMALRGARLERAARLAQLDVASVQRMPAANIHAAAALLAEEARAADVAHLPPEQWGVALEAFSGIDLPAGRRAYAREIVARLSTAEYSDGAGAAAVPCPTPPTPPRAGPTGTTTVFRASPNFNQRQAGIGGQVTMIIVHTCEGGYVGCWSWLTNTVSQVSAHYVINEDGTEISQLVDEPARAWHIGATYDCTLNRARRCDLNGVQSNHFTVGIEHGGFAAQQTFPTQQIDVSAQLACAITRRHNIPRDNQHIVAHGQLQPYNRTDPGPNWPWIRYLALVQRHCGEIVVDDNNAHNDPAFARVSAPPSWTATAATAGYYGAGYRFAATTATTDEPIVFEFYVESAGARTIEARWTAGSNRSSAARFIVKRGDIIVATTDVDQRTAHDEWRAIANAQLSAGWHSVELSRRGPEGSVVVADAIRIR